MGSVVIMINIYLHSLETMLLVPRLSCRPTVGVVCSLKRKADRYCRANFIFTAARASLCRHRRASEMRGWAGWRLLYFAGKGGGGGGCWGGWLDESLAIARPAGQVCER